MLYHTFDFLTDSELGEITKDLMMCSEWIDGIHSASGNAELFKRNLQLSSGSDLFKTLEKKISKMIMDENSPIGIYAFPKRLSNILFSRTSTGMFYRNHLDVPYVSQRRRDYSFTLFLTDPSQYEGGELVLSVPPEQKAIKLKAGSIIVYPTKYLHEVREVTSGERMVCVGWIESHIKKDDEREILGYLKTSKIHIDNNDILKSRIALDIAYNRLYKYFGD